MDSSPILHGATKVAAGSFAPDRPLVRDQMQAFEAAARAIFGHSSLRDHQKQVLESIAKGKDCLAVLPTGSGKSLCYAIPAITRPGLVLVVSPLISLIRDQVRKFTAWGIPCAAFDSMQTGDEKREVWDRVHSGQIRVLLVSPERLARPSFRAGLGEYPVQLVAVDEAHCVSQWGFNFRPEYRRVGEYLRDFGGVQKIALTATATSKARVDIRRALEMSSPDIVVGRVARENLSLGVLSVGNTKDQTKAIVQATRDTQGCGVIYVATRKLVHEIQSALEAEGIAATSYHAGLAPEIRRDNFAKFMSGKARVIVATNAFGMGIDKPDIRFVHHVGLPQSVEQYVQEIGRAGRDGKSARCLLVACSRDYYVQRFMIEKSFPDLELVKKAFVVARDYLGSSEGQHESSLMRHIRQISGLPEDDIRIAEEVLFREGLLNRFKSISWDGEDQDALITLGPGGDDERRFWSEYTLRKLDQLGRLDAMRNYLEAQDRSAWLNTYFAD